MTNKKTVIMIIIKSLFAVFLIINLFLIDAVLFFMVHSVEGNLFGIAFLFIGAIIGMAWILFDWILPNREVDWK